MPTGEQVHARPCASDVHQWLRGHVNRRLEVCRQAYRVRGEDTDELLLLRSGRDFWVACRLGSRVSVWACHDLIDAEELFESTSPANDGWREARPQVA